MRRPFRRVGTGAPQDPAAERHDQAAFLRQADELVGEQQAALGMAPAHQRLGAAALAPADVDDGLVVQLEFVAQQRAPHVLFELAAVARVRLHGGLEEAIAVAALGFRLVEREVGVAHELVGVAGVLRRQRDADRGADDDLASIDVVGLGERQKNAVRQDGGLVALVHVGNLDHCELIAAESRDDVEVAHQAAQPVSDRLQERVADRMPERIVDRLEAVEVEHQHRERLAVAFHARQRLVHLLQEQRTIGEAGQRVIARHVRELGLDALLRGDVLMDRDPAAVVHALMIDGDDAPVAQVVDDGIVLAHRHVFDAVGRVAAGRRRGA